MAHVASSHKGGASSRNKELAPVRPEFELKNWRGKKVDFKIDKQLSSYLLLLAAAAATLSWPLCSLSALLFSSPLLPSFLSSCSLLLPLTLSSLPCLLSSLHAQMDGSRSLTRCSTLGRRVSSLCLSVCLSVSLSLLLLLLHSASSSPLSC